MAQSGQLAIVTEVASDFQSVPYLNKEPEKSTTQRWDLKALRSVFGLWGGMRERILREPRDLSLNPLP